MNKNVYLFFRFLIFFLVVHFMQAQETILIRNGTIVPIAGKKIENGSLLIIERKIAKIGSQIEAPSGATIIDAGGKYVFPGLVALMTIVGVTGYPGTASDTDELGVATPQMDPYDAINPEEDIINVTRIGGVTTVMTISGSKNIINGKSIVMNLEGSLAEEMVIKRYVAQIFNMGAKGDSLSESKRPGDYPTTFPGVNAFIRGYLNKVIRYAERNRKLDKREKKNKESITEEAFERDLELEALIPVLERKIPVVFITHNMVTIQNALRIIKEYNLKGILYATADILQFVDQLAAEKIPVIWAGTTTMPQRGEPFDLNYRAASVLADKGILFAIVPSGFEVNASFNVRNLPEPASLSVAHGLAEEEAIKAITINPAKILGIDEIVGSLEVGKIADIVIWSDSPIQMTSRVHKVIINGKIIPLTSIQTQLRDKFEKIVRERMKEKKKQ